MAARSSTDRSVASPALPLRWLATAALCLVSARVLAAPSAPVDTDAGRVSGTAGRDPAVAVFRGIPFAAPPVGPLRWKPPQPPAHWQGVRAADHFGDTCAQPPPPNAGARVAISEDCLTLNVWTAARTAGEKRPVLVWIFGGGFFNGSASAPNSDGEALSRKGIVVVTTNYRVGPFGFLAHPELSGESPHKVSGNYGLLDMIACLQWVKRNIAAFGGDPSRVTIAGQSSGGGSVLLLAQSPLASGLFRGVISQSGARAIGDPTFVQVRTLAATEKRGVRFAAAHGAHSLRQLRELTWQQVLEGVDMRTADPADDGDDSLPVYRPAIDGWVLPLPIGETYARGAQQDVPVMTGFNLDEMGAEPRPGLTLDGLRQMTRRDYGPMADELLTLYPVTADAQAEQVQRTFSRDRNRTTSWLWATAWSRHARSPVYTYFWTHAPPGPRGAFHGSEIAYAFDSLDAMESPWTARDREVAGTVSSYWANFVRNGDPNGPGLPRWPAFDGRAEIMVIGDDSGPAPVAGPAKLDFMKRFFAAQKAW